MTDRSQTGWRSRPWRGAAALAGWALVVAALAAVVREPARSLRREVLVDRCVEALAGGLARCRAATGSYIDEPLLGGGELALRLLEVGWLDALPLNPDTGRRFGAVDLETDLVFYTAPAGAGSYRIEVLDPTGERLVAQRVGD